MLIGLKGDNYYSKVFKRVNYKLWNITFWVVITHVWSFTFESLLIICDLAKIHDVGYLSLKYYIFFFKEKF